MRAMRGTAGMARVELVRPTLGCPFCKHRSWVVGSAARPCRGVGGSFRPNPSAAWSLEASRAKTTPPRPQLSFSFSGVLE